MDGSELPTPDRTGAAPWISAPATPPLVAAAILIHIVLAFVTCRFTLQAYPNAGDEYAYLLSAEMFSQGRLSVPSPEHREFFDLFHVLNDGKFYGKYPPGWPLILAIGVSFGVPWVVNPILGGLTIYTLYSICRNHFAAGTDTLVLLLASANPFLVFNSASYFSHSACLLLVCLAFHALFDWMAAPRSTAAPAFFGLASGFAFAVRPFTAVAIFVPACAIAALHARRNPAARPPASRLAIAAAPALAALGLFLLYNHLQTGNAFEQPFTRYSPGDAPSLPKTFSETGRRLWDNIGLRLVQLTLWLPLSVPLAALFAARRPGSVPARILLASSASLLAAYYLFAPLPGTQYGPRYMYEAAGALLIVSACALKETPRMAAAALAVSLLVGLGILVHQSRERAEEIRLKKNPYDLVRERNLSQALVFIRTGVGSAPALDLTRNGLRFDGSVLYVLDRGDRNGTLLAEHPDRKAYVYEYDESRKIGLLRTLEEAPPPKYER
jgi:hypothetical protein